MQLRIISVIRAGDLYFLVVCEIDSQRYCGPTQGNKGKVFSGDFKDGRRLRCNLRDVWEAVCR
jgi:hypothetical protein